MCALFPTDFKDYPPTYKNAAETLLQNLMNEKCFSVQKEKFEHFCKHFSVVPKLWKEWILIEYETTCKPLEGYEYRQKCKKMVENFFEQIKKHFYIEPEFYEKFHTLLNRPCRQLLNFPDFDKISTWIVFSRFQYIVFLENALKYPHAKLNEILEIYKRRCDSPITKELLQKHKKSKELYEKIMATTSQIQWLTLLLETENDEFIVQNIEARLSENLCGTEIWFFYLNFFEKQNDIRILNVCQRYCRIFIEDAKMLKFYIEKVEKFNFEDFDVGYWINDLTEFYKYFGKNKNIPKFLETPSSSMMKQKEDEESSELKKTINNQQKIFYDSSLNYIQQQSFPFSKPQMHYILNNFNIKIYRNLIQTCKYFFNKTKILPIWHLELRWIVEDFFHQNSVYLGTFEDSENMVGTENERREIITFKNKKIWLEESMEIFAKFHLFDKIYQCDIRYLRILDCDITLKQYELLVKSERIQEIYLFMMAITTSDKEVITLERLLKFLPNAYEIILILNPIKIEPTTSPVLSEMKRNCKLEKFSINNITDSIEPSSFCDFFKDNITSTSSIAIQYINQISDDYQNDMKERIAAIVKASTEGEQTPKIQLYF